MAKPKTRRLRQFDGRDRWVVLAMVGIPTILHVGLVWIPTIASILLSFTDWKGIRFSDINWVGLKNYDQIFTAFHRNFFQALINNTVLLIFLFIGPTALGIAPGLPPRQGHPGNAILSGRLLHPGRALPCRRRLHVAERHLLDRERTCHAALRRRQIDRLDRQPVVLDPIRRDYGISRNFAGDPGRDRLAAHRLHHGALPGRAEERRQLAARGGHAGRQQRVAGLPPRHLSRRSSRSTW